MFEASFQGSQKLSEEIFKDSERDGTFQLSSTKDWTGKYRAAGVSIPNLLQTYYILTPALEPGCS
jgi:hypothetical protein